MKRKQKIIMLSSIVIILVVALVVLIALVIENSKPDIPKVGLSNYPDIYLKGKTFDAFIVMDDFATDDDLIIGQRYLEELMKRYEIKPYTLIQYKHLAGLYNSDAIFIGTCNTIPHNKFVNLFVDCLSMEDNIAIMRYVEKDNVHIIEIVGKDFKDTEEAVSVLVNYKDYNLSGREIQVRNDENGKVFTRITGK